MKSLRLLLLAVLGLLAPVLASAQYNNVFLGSRAGASNTTGSNNSFL